MKILQKIQSHFDKSLPFVAYKKPNETQISAFFQQTNEVFYTQNYTENGFVLAPFNDKEPSILIPKKQSEFIQEPIVFDIVINNEVPSTINKKAEEFHQKIVDNAIQKIVDNEFRKVVLSRREQVELTNFNLVETFKKLIVNYPTAMVYVWFHPKVGLWLGATPETLVKINGNEFETMSLAGTQVDYGNPIPTWQAKELDEQKVVTDYIVEKLQSICEQISANKVETIKAGSLLHLRTKIQGVTSSAVENSSQKELIQRIHPTPAVCGFPKKKTKNYILKTENYNREFYTGFLGELNLFTDYRLSTTDLYVNLRCMQIKNQKALIYVGGGITKDSIPEKEWEETVAKLQTMRRVL